MAVLSTDLEAASKLARAGRFGSRLRGPQCAAARAGGAFASMDQFCIRKP